MREHISRYLPGLTLTESSSPSELVSTITLTPRSCVTVPGWTAMFASSTTIGNWTQEREREGERVRERESKRGRERYKCVSTINVGTSPDMMIKIPLL